TGSTIEIAELALLCLAPSHQERDGVAGARRSQLVDPAPVLTIRVAVRAAEQERFERFELFGSVAFGGLDEHLVLSCSFVVAIGRPAQYPRLDQGQTSALCLSEMTLSERTVDEVEEYRELPARNGSLLQLYEQLGHFERRCELAHEQERHRQLFPLSFGCIQSQQPFCGGS